MTQQYDETGYSVPGGGYRDVAHRAQGHIGRYQQVKAEGQQLADQGRNRVTSAGQRVAQAAGGPSGAAPAQAKAIVPPEQSQAKGQPAPGKAPTQPIQPSGQEQAAKRDPVAKAQSKKARKDTMKRQGAAVAKSPHTRNVVKGAVAGAAMGVKGGPRGMAVGAARGAAQSGVQGFRKNPSKAPMAKQGTQKPHPAAKRSLQQPVHGTVVEQGGTSREPSHEVAPEVSEKDMPKERKSKRASFGEKSGGAIKGAATGAMNGMVLGPKGAAAGAVVGAAHGRYKASKTAKTEYTTQQQQKTAARQQAEADMENMLTSRGLNKEQQQSDVGMERG